MYVGVCEVCEGGQCVCVWWGVCVRTYVCVGVCEVCEGGQCVCVCGGRVCVCVCACAYVWGLLRCVCE